MYACSLWVRLMPDKAQEAVVFPGTGSTGGYEPPLGS